MHQTIKINLPNKSMQWSFPKNYALMVFTVIEHMHFATTNNFFSRELQDSKLKERLENLFMQCCYATEKIKIVPHAFVCKEERHTVCKRTKVRKCDLQVA